MSIIAEMIAKVRCSHGPAARLWVLLVDMGYTSLHANENYSQSSPRGQFRDMVLQIMEPIRKVFQYE